MPEPGKDVNGDHLHHAVFEHMRDGVAVYRFRNDGSRQMLDCVQCSGPSEVHFNRNRDNVIVFSLFLMSCDYYV